MTRRLYRCSAAALATFGALLSSCVSQQSNTRVLDHAEQPAVSQSAPPSGVTVREVQWLRVASSEVGVLTAAVARPRGEGPFPALIILHGTHGFAEEYVQLAKDVARDGVVGIAACWFAGGSGSGARFVTPITCTEAPAMPAAATSVARNTVDTLVQAVRGLAGVRRDQVLLFGHSRGGGAALHYALTGGGVSGIALNSVGYPLEVSERAAGLRIPLLMLHGIFDSASEGGSAMTSVEMARRFEGALRRAGRIVEVKYYEGGHNAIFTNPEQYLDEVRTITAFVKTHVQQ